VTYENEAPPEGEYGATGGMAAGAGGWDEAGATGGVAGGDWNAGAGATGEWGAQAGYAQ
jgi:hypothetical protein